MPDEIPAVEFEALRPHLPAKLANRWYQLDENAVCPLPDGIGLEKGRDVLQPRAGEFTDYHKWFGRSSRANYDDLHTHRQQPESFYGLPLVVKDQERAIPMMERLTNVGTPRVHGGVMPTKLAQRVKLTTAEDDLGSTTRRR